MKFFSLAIATAVLSLPAAPSSGAPNVLWIIADDLSPDLGCYGRLAVETPHCDRLASEGARFTHAYATAPVCSPSRSALITGCYQTSIGCHHHRTLSKRPLPDGVLPITEVFRNAGYQVYNANATLTKRGKADYNFTPPVSPMYDGHDWREARDRPFFAQVQIYQPHRPFFGANKREDRAAELDLPRFLPDHPLARADFADYLAAVEQMDDAVGRVLDRLESDGLRSSTVVFFFGDHGRPMPRCKQWLYDGGLRTPLIISDPSGTFSTGVVDRRMVSLIDIAATSLTIAGIEVPGWMQGIDFSAPGSAGRNSIFAARDRMGATPDRVRSVQSGGYKFIRNFKPSLPYVDGPAENAYVLQHHPTHTLFKALRDRRALPPPMQGYLARSRPELELYHLESDPAELLNLAYDPEHAIVAERMSDQLEDWMYATKDLGTEFDPDAQRTAAANAAAVVKLRQARGADDQAMLQYWLRRYGLEE